MVSFFSVALISAALVPNGTETSTQTAQVSPSPEDDWELGVLPAINFDSDFGFGFGAIAVLAALHPDCDPWRWRFQLQLFASAKENASGTLEVPFQSHYLNFDVPSFYGTDLRLNGEIGFRRFSNSGYYGIGNRATPRTFVQAELDADPNLGRFHRYDRIYPSLVANGRYMLHQRPKALGRRRLELMFGFDFSVNLMDVYEGSLLAEHLALRDAGGPDAEDLEALLHGLEDHTLLVLNLGLLFDTRDDEYAPNQGIFAELSTRISPGVQQNLQYAGFHASVRGFVSLWRPYLVFAGRLASDLLVGNVPLYQLSQFGALSPRDGPGGGSSLRGVLLQQYVGKVKLFSNFELRARFLRFTVLEQKIRLAAVAFFDVGRVWADTSDRQIAGESLDGSALNLKTGTGGGLRFQWGTSFLIRFDYAYAPSDGTSGLYIDVGHVF